MTTEPTEDAPAAREVSYLKIQVPGYPYSVISVPLSAEWVAFAVEMAKHVAEKMAEAFPPEAPYAPSAPSAPNEPQPPIVAFRTYDRPMGRLRPNDAPAYCPEHNGAPCQVSAARYNPDGDKMYHALDERDWYRLDDGRTAKNHTLWWRETVDADGNSNADRAMPADGRR